MRTYRPTTGCSGSSLVMLLLLAGCGGGGSGGGVAGIQPLTYSGSTSQAVVTTLNSSRLTANLFGSNEAAGIIGGTSIEGGNSTRNAGTGLEGVTRTLNRASRAALASVKRPSSAQGTVSGVLVPVDVTELCDGGNGTLRTMGTIDDVTFTGTVTGTFTNCLLDGNTLNGQVTIQILAFEFTCGGIFTDLITTIPRITIRAPGVSVDAGGSLRVQINTGSSTETVTNNVVNLNNVTDVMTKGDNLQSVGVVDNICSPTSISNLVFTGKIFDNVHGFVDVTTITPLQLTLLQPFPSTGEILLAGNTSGVVVTALSSTMVQLQPDTDGNGTGDGFPARMNWTELSGPIGADIADTPDGDGMHNSWETFYGLDPGNAADATLDNDAVGGNNLAEYQAGTNPNVP